MCRVERLASSAPSHRHNMGYTVYRLTSPSNKVYIGMTSQPVKKRWKAGRGYKNCVLFAKAIEKYGWENFKKEILFEGLDEEEAKALEYLFIKTHKSNNPRYGYNLTEGGEGTKGIKRTEEQKEHLRQINLGKHLSEETKRKIGNAHKGNKYCLGKKLSEERKRQISEMQMGAKNQHAKRVICLETLKVYDTMTQAREETGATKITDCCKHHYKHKSSNGLHWEYYDESLSAQDYKDILERLIKEEYENKHHKPSELNKQRNRERTSVAVVCVETNEIFSSIRDACSKYGIHPSNLCNCCKGKKKTANGLHWRYATP